MPNSIRRFSPLCVWLLVAICSGAAQGGPPRQIILIVADDLRADVLSVYGGPVQTPNLARLATNGRVFTRATCGYPICHVSRTEMLTGRWMVQQAAAGKVIPILPQWMLWPQYLSQAGWHTVYAGKWHVEGTPWTRGYAETSALFSSGGAKGMPPTLPRSATDLVVTGYVGWTFKTNDNTALLEQGVGLTPDTDARITDGATEVLARRVRDKPLFLHVNYTAPHDPLHWPRGCESSFPHADIELPKNFRAEHPFDHGNISGRDERLVPAPRTAASVQSERAVYYALVRNLDAQVGRLLDSLEASGSLKETLIIFTSDHGLALGSHGLMGKQNQYEHTVGVPLLLAGPGIPAGPPIDGQCALRDLFPTTCEVLGLAMPSGVQGRSLIPLLRSEQDEVHHAVFGYFTDTQRMIRTADGWKLVWYPQMNREQLFQVFQDPDELQDLATSEDANVQARLRQLRRSLQVWLRDRGDPQAQP